MGGLGYFFLFSTRPNLPMEAAFIGLSIYFYYNLSRVIRVRDYYAMQSNLHLKWVSKNLTEILISLAFVFVFLILLYYKLHPSIESLGWLAVISILYVFLREKPFLKNILIAKSWCLAFGLFGEETNFLFAYFLGLSLWYDFKDDKEIDYSKVVLTAMSLGLAGFIFSNHYSFGFLENSANMIVHFLLFYLSLKLKKEFIYLFVVDIMILVMSLAHYLLLNS